MTGRFPRLQSLSLPPGTCFVCGKDKCLTGFTDTGIHDEWLGSFYVCDDCLIEMARGIGMRTEAEVRDMRVELGETRIELSKVLGQLTQLQALRVLIREFSDGPAGGPAGLSADTAGGHRRGDRRRAAEPR